MGATFRDAQVGGEAVRYEFAGCELDLPAHRLTARGAVRHLERKTFELLVCPLSHRDRAVTRHELNAALWAGCAVSDGALTQCVWTARRAIGDEKGRSSVIQTLNGIGYRFVGEVTVTREEPGEAPSPPPVEHNPLVVEALNHLSRAQKRVASASLPAPGPGKDELLQAAIACRRFADSVLGGHPAPRHA
ncbi:MAG TPA: winged helix-turn-helix domain-containing protein [Polyangiaceae bacterium]